MYFFTADEHYGHPKIIEYCNRPFANVDEMDAELVSRHNSVVRDVDIVIHVGDFTLKRGLSANSYVQKLKGTHIFIRGSHDYWLPRTTLSIWERKIEGADIIACHYAMRTWPRSHYNSWQVHGHSHGKLPPIGKQVDVGVDAHNFYPVSFIHLTKLMESRENNPNFLSRPRSRS